MERLKLHACWCLLAVAACLLVRLYYLALMTDGDVRVDEYLGRTVLVEISYEGDRYIFPMELAGHGRQYTTTIYSDRESMDPSWLRERAMLAADRLLGAQ